MKNRMHPFHLAGLVLAGVGAVIAIPDLPRLTFGAALGVLAIAVGISATFVPPRLYEAWVETVRRNDPHK